MPADDFVRNPDRFADLGSLGRVGRLGLSTRGNTSLAAADVLEAFRRGVNFFNWCGHPDGLSEAVRGLGPLRRQVIVSVQVGARDAAGARQELERCLGELGTGYIDVVTYYYLESQDEWDQIHATGGAAEYLEEQRRNGVVRAIGATTHQRRLAAKLARDRGIDLLMIRYNAAHRAAEREVFPVATKLEVPIVAYTCLRWGALLEPTAEDPEGFSPPPAPDWYRFVLCHRAVTVALMAPNGRRELEEDLTLVDDWHGCDASEYTRLREHGDRVHRNAGGFP